MHSKPQTFIAKKWISAGERPSLESLLKGLLTQYEERLSLCQKSFSLKRVHDLRVASRRLIVCLKELRESDSKLGPKRLIRRVRKVLKKLAPLRDLQVQKSIIRENGTVLLDRLSKDEASLKKKSLKSLLKQESKLRASFQKFRMRLNDSRGRLVILEAPTIAGLKQSLTAQLAGLTVDSQSLDLENAKRVHKFRLKIKSFRYRRDLVSALNGGFMENLDSALVELQRVTGQIHDIDMVSEEFGNRKLREKTPPLYDQLVSERGALTRELRSKLFQFSRLLQGEILH